MMPLAIYRKYKQGDRSKPYVPMENEGLLEIARGLHADDDTRSVLRRVGVHGDFTPSEEEEIDGFVINSVERLQLKSPHPANLIIPIALARQFAEGQMDPADTAKALDFIADRRVDGVEQQGLIHDKPNRLSELLPIMHSLDKREDIKAPYEELRHKKLKMNQDFFDNKEQGDLYYARAFYFVNQQRFKYALMNRSIYGFEKIAFLLNMFAERLIDRLYDEKAIDYLLSSNKSENKYFHIVDDRKG